MIINVWDPSNKTWYAVKGSLPFELHGEKFAAHKYAGTTVHSEVRWTVAHVETGFAVLTPGLYGGRLPATRSDAIQRAKDELGLRSPAAIKAAAERAREKNKDVIATYGGPENVTP